MIRTVQPSLFRAGHKSLPTDICANRHKNNPASVEANRKVDKSKDRAAVLAVVERLGMSYSKEIARELGKPLNAISGRLSELKALGLLHVLDEKREGCQCVSLF